MRGLYRSRFSGFNQGGWYGSVEGNNRWLRTTGNFDAAHLSGIRQSATICSREGKYLYIYLFIYTRKLNNKTRNKHNGIPFIGYEIL